jgi:plasmid stabilization system protein ParE
MTRLMEQAIATVRSWPDAQQDEAAEILLALGHLGPAAYQATEEELNAIDEALAQIERGEFATDADVALPQVKVRYSPRAVRDLAGIADYLVERSPRGAQFVDHRIRKTVDLIAAFPGSGRALEQRRGVRVMPVGRYPYLVFYAI